MGLSGGAIAGIVVVVVLFLVFFFFDPRPSDSGKARGHRRRNLLARGPFAKNYKGDRIYPWVQLITNPELL